MARQPVLINLKIRSLTVLGAGEPPRKVDNSLVRFTKVMELESIPKPGTLLEVTAGSGSVAFECAVTRAEWDERENMFVVSCSYTRPSMRQVDYAALAEQTDWTMKSLL